MKDVYIVEVIPHEYFMGARSPEISLTVDRVTHWWVFPKDAKQVFDTCNRDLFKCVSECNNYFARNNIDPKQVQWPDFCKYIKDYKE